MGWLRNRSYKPRKAWRKLLARFRRLIGQNGFQGNGIEVGIGSARLHPAHCRIGEIDRVDFFLHFVFKKTDGGAAPETYEHEPGFVDDQEKKSQQKVAGGDPCGAFGPTLKNGSPGRENAYK